jgi:RNA polymerase sigma factor (sigma-70 family)
VGVIEGIGVARRNAPTEGALPKHDPRFWEVPLDPQVLESLSEEPPSVPDQESERKARQRADAVEQLRILIATRLTERQRQVVCMYFFQGLTQQEIASSLEIAQQVVSKHLFGVIRKGRRIGGAMAKLRSAALDLGIDPSKWV